MKRLIQRLLLAVYGHEPRELQRGIEIQQERIERRRREREEAGTNGWHPPDRGPVDARHYEEWMNLDNGEDKHGR